MYEALRKIKVERDGELIDVFPGEPVPEADSWRPTAIRAAISVGRIKEVLTPPSPGRRRESRASAPGVQVS
jgi:hypothetical protein